MVKISGRIVPAFTCNHCSHTCVQLLVTKLPSGVSVSDACADVAAQVRENVRLRRAFLMEGMPGEGLFGDLWGLCSRR